MRSRFDIAHVVNYRQFDNDHQSEYEWHQQVRQCVDTAWWEINLIGDGGGGGGGTQWEVCDWHYTRPSGPRISRSGMSFTNSWPANYISKHTPAKNVILYLTFDTNRSRRLSILDDLSATAAGKRVFRVVKCDSLRS